MRITSREMTEKEAMQELLQQLAYTIHSKIHDELAKGTLKPEYRPYFRWKVTKFKKRHGSPAAMTRQSERFSKPYWGKAIQLIYERTKKLKVYNDALTAIMQVYVEGFFHESHLQTLILRIAEDILEGKIKTSNDSAKYITSFLKDLNREEQEYRAEVQLKSLYLQPDSIHLDENAKLRKPVRQDFERAIPLSFPTQGTAPLKDPATFLHTRIYARATATLDIAPASALQQEIEREIAVLRLFRFGAIQYTQYTVNTDSIINMTISSMTKGSLLGEEEYFISKKDVKPLKIFWANMKEVELPSSVYPGKQEEPDELSIAYDRYGDSLEVGILEKRVSSAVMGLEALYLTEIDELPYRLSMRVGKLLSLTGSDYKPSEVRDMIKDAYKIRNKYVHGAILTPADKRKLEEKHGDLHEFCKAIIDYLRASIVALLKRPTKTSLIKKIDDSFLDRKKEEEVTKILFMPYVKEKPHAKTKS